MFYVYVLKSLASNRHYFGYTHNVDSRLKQHNKGNVLSTRNFRPWILLGFEVYQNRNEARWREHELKSHGEKRKEFIKALKPI